MTSNIWSLAAIFCMVQTGVLAIDCYSCVNCASFSSAITSNATLETCPTGSAYCITFISFFPDVQIHLMCGGASCSSEEIINFYRIECCSTDACNSLANHTTISLFNLIAVVFLAVLILNYGYSYEM